MTKPIVISSNDDDFSTNEVIDWLFYKGKEVIRINEQDPVSFSSLHVSDNPTFELNVKGKPHTIQSNSSFWYRRGHVQFLDQIKELEFSQETKDEIFSQPRIKTYLHDELEEIGILFNLFVGEKYNERGVGSYFNNFVVKIENLFLAQRLGVDVPKTAIVTTKKQLIDFYNSCENGIITKAIRNGVGIYEDSYAYEGLTKEFKEDEFDSLREEFFPTLLQEKLDKFIEIRSFFYANQFYSTAIFSQGDDQTKLDFRDYNESKPNRTPPFKIPIDVENRLRAFMKEAKLNSGSIDIVVTNSGKFVFLEVNPIGQFSQVSRPCNYYLEEIVADGLITENYG